MKHLIKPFGIFAVLFAITSSANASNTTAQWLYEAKELKIILFLGFTKVDDHFAHLYELKRPNEPRQICVLEFDDHGPTDIQCRSLLEAMTAVKSNTDQD